jgi:hypothetical protein
MIKLMPAPNRIYNTTGTAIIRIFDTVKRRLIVICFTSFTSEEFYKASRLFFCATAGVCNTYPFRGGLPNTPCSSRGLHTLYWGKGIGD